MVARSRGKVARTRPKAHAKATKVKAKSKVANAKTAHATKGKAPATGSLGKVGTTAKNTQKGNARKGKTYSVVKTKGGLVAHKYTINGKTKIVVPHAAAQRKARAYKRKAKGSTGGGQFSK